MKLGNGSEYQFFVQKICHSFCVQIAKYARCINTDTSSNICFSITLNWKLSTGGSFLMLNLLLASCRRRPEVNKKGLLYWSPDLHVQLYHTCYSCIPFDLVSLVA